MADTIKKLENARNVTKRISNVLSSKKSILEKMRHSYKLGNLLIDGLELDKSLKEEKDEALESKIELLKAEMENVEEYIDEKSIDLFLFEELLRLSTDLLSDFAVLMGSTGEEVRK